MPSTKDLAVLICDFKRFLEEQVDQHTRGAYHKEDIPMSPHDSAVKLEVTQYILHEFNKRIKEVS